MSHHHDPRAGTQNQGNSLGDRSCVRQSKLYRQYESGNGVKDILGSSHLAWNANEKEGAYKGHKVYDHNRDNGPAGFNEYKRAQQGQDKKEYGNNSKNYGEDQQFSHSNGGSGRVNHHYPVDHPLNRRFANQEDEDDEYYRAKPNKAPQSLSSYRRASHDSDPNENDENSGKYDKYRNQNPDNSYRQTQGMVSGGSGRHKYPVENESSGHYGGDSGRNSKRVQFDNDRASDYNQRNDAYGSGRQVSAGIDHIGGRDEEFKSSSRGGPKSKSTRPW